MSTESMLPSLRADVPAVRTAPRDVGPERLEMLVAEWLLGYRSAATRLSYGDALGLPRPWVRALGTASAFRNVVEEPKPGQSGPPVRTGRFRELAWLRWCAAHGVHPLTAIGLDLKRWLEALDAAGVAKSTRGHRLAVVAEFYRFLVERGVLDANPAAFDRRGLQLGTRGDTSATVVLTAAQVGALLDAAGTARQGTAPVMRSRAVAIVALFTLGLRVAELTALRREDLHTTRGRRALRVTGKGGKTRVVFLSGLAERALTDYLAERDRHQDAALPARVGQAAARRLPLIATGAGTAMNPRDVWALIRRLSVAAGPTLAEVADRMGPHTLRHFYVTAAAEGGADMTHVQADVGHASVETTHRVYNQATRAPERSAVDVVERALLRHRSPDRAVEGEITRLEHEAASADPLDRLLAVAGLERLARDVPATAEAVSTVLERVSATSADHPKVADAARAARQRIGGDL
ncbi:tyrosine-type recombinase/integrase [Saccharothrix deserti]|uniref:tyrosine-type recombinase/integrase n=1 Tax=Saccharothrix deserti TaxID=2593674 RepID=UPI00131B4670|nr:tyrosine-type recombinase/integrase [Saccharothrix deserti]